MNYNGNMKFFAYGRCTDGYLLSSYCLEPKSEANFKKEASNLAAKLKLLNLKPEERQKVSTTNGFWFCTVDKNQIACLALASSTYPERHAYAMIRECQAEIEKISNYFEQEESKIKIQLKKFLPTTLKKYDDLKKLDKLYEAQSNVEDITRTMSENLTKIVANTENLHKLDAKSEEMRDMAGLFAKNSTELATIMYWRNMKMNVIIGATGLSVLLYLFIPMLS